MSTSDPLEPLIARHVGLAMGAAALPVPLADVAAVAAVQLALAERLARACGVRAERVGLRALVLALAGATATRVGASALKGLPGIGTWLGGAAQVGLAGASTWALGQALREHFEEHGERCDPDPGALGARHARHLARAPGLVRALRQVRFDDEVEQRAEALERWSRLQRAGVLTEEEVRRLRAPD